MLTEKQQEAVDAVAKYGSQRKAASALGICLNALQHRLGAAQVKIAKLERGKGYKPRGHHDPLRWGRKRGGKAHEVQVTERIQFIGDVHIPAEHRDYLAFCVAVRDKYQLTTHIQVGDMIDFHALSYHESDPDLPNAGPEYELARDRVVPWRDEYPILAITQGNHCNIPLRKAYSHGIPKAFLKGYNELFDTNWLWLPKQLTFKLACGMPVMVTHAAAASL